MNDGNQKKKGRPKKTISVFDTNTFIKVETELILYLPIHLKDLNPEAIQPEIIQKTDEIEDFENKSYHYVSLKTPLIETIDKNFVIEENTKIACWWCSYNFDTTPIFVPERFYNNKFYVFGCFCCYNCAVSYIFSMNDYKVWDRYSLLKKIYYITHGSNINFIPAPEKEILEKFGGSVSIDEWRKNTIKCTKEYRLVFPPMIPIVPVVEIKVK